MDCEYSLEPSRGSSSNNYHNLCFEQKYKKKSEILSENVQFFCGEIINIFE